MKISDEKAREFLSMIEADMFCAERMFVEAQSFYAMEDGKVRDHALENMRSDADMMSARYRELVAKIDEFTKIAQAGEADAGAGVAG